MKLIIAAAIIGTLFASHVVLYDLSHIPHFKSYTDSVPLRAISNKRSAMRWRRGGYKPDGFDIENKLIAASRYHAFVIFT
jgi:hypothetical protein